MQKKMACIFLALIMLLSYTAAFAEVGDNTVFSPVESTEMAETKSIARLNLEKQTQGIFGENDPVELIIGLQTDYFQELGRGYEPEELRDSSNMEAQIEFAKRTTERALEEMKEAGIDFELFDILDLILVGFTGRASYGEALKIAELPFVASVGVSVEYHQPKITEMNLRMPNSNKIIHQNQIHGQYDGSGMLVAVLDSGADYEHPAFYLGPNGLANKKIQVKDQAELDTLKNKLGIRQGVYCSEKIPFAYNYYDRNAMIKDTNDRTGMHGQHVAGTIGGNKVDLPTGETFMGVAPEAQLLIMRVFGQRVPTTSSRVYVVAMNEAVKFGADSINMSLGSPAGQLSYVDAGTIQAIDNASKIGCIVAIAGGNESQFGQGVGNPMADYPDYGVLGSPAVSNWSLAVASSENTHVAQAVVEIFDNDNLISKIPYGTSNQPHSFDATQKFALADAQKALSVDAVPADVSGKVALIERGGETFVNKANHVAAKGAVGAIIYNGETQGNDIIGMKLDDSLTIPVISIRRSDALELLSHLNTRTVKVGKDIQFLPNDNAGKISDFSNWGMTADGDFKPDIMAPGGNIYSTLNDGEYGNMSGTSMATPHVAGGIALVRSRVNKEFSDLPDKEKFTLVRNLLMSSAEPHRNPVTNVFSSPRNQGSGVMNLHAAVNTKVILYDETTKETKLSLKNVDDKFSVRFIAKNLSKQKSFDYNYELHLTTDEVRDGRMTLNPMDLGSYPGGHVSIAPNSTEVIQMEVDATQFKEKLIGKMPNGYFLEGFVVLKSTSGEVDISIPFVGFRGEFENLTAVEPFINELAKVGKKPFYYDADLEGTEDGNTDFTHLSSEVGNTRIILGQGLDYDKDHYSFVTPAISPNGDKRVENFNFHATILRNVESVKGFVYKLNEQGEKVGEGTQMFYGSNEQKHHFSNDSRRPKSKDYRITPNKLTKLEDGKYIFEVVAQPTARGSKTTVQSLEFYVDRVKPSVKDGVFENRWLKFDVVEQSGLMKEKVSYKKGSDRVVLEKQSEGYLIPEGVELKDVLVELMDCAYNERLFNGQEILDGVIEGKIQFEVEMTPPTATKPKYQIQVVTNDTEERIVDPNEIRPGEYKVIVHGYEGAQNQYVLKNNLPIIVKVTKENLNPKVILRFEVVPVKQLNFSINRNGYQGPREIFAIDKTTNREFKMTDGFFSSYVYVPFGTYRFEARKVTPGYFAVFDPAELVVDENLQNNRVKVDFGKGQEMKVTILTKPESLKPVYMVYDEVEETMKKLEVQPWKKGGKYRIFPEKPMENYYPKEDWIRLEWNDDEKEKIFTFEYLSNEGSGKIEVEDNTASLGFQPTYVAQDFYKGIGMDYGKEFEKLDDLKPGHYYMTVKEEGVNKQFDIENDLQHVLVEKDKTSKVFMKWTRVGGSLTIESKDTNDADVDDVEYEVKNSEGKVQMDLTALKFGTYTVRVKDYPKQNYQLQGDSEQTVEINEANPEVKTKFVFVKKDIPADQAEIHVEFMIFGTTGNLPDGYEVYTEDAQNHRIDAEKIELGKYRMRVPADATKKSYMIQSKCTVNGYATITTYNKVEVQGGSATGIKVMVGATMPLKITSKFNDNANLPVSYKAVRTRNDERSGAIYTDMNNLYKGGEYEISPVEVPAGYTVSPTMQETEKSYEGGFKPMTFTYTRTSTPTGSLTLKAEDELGEEVPGVVFEVKKGGTPISDWSNPEFGTYEVSVKSYDETKYLLLDSTPKQVTISAMQPNGKAIFIFRKIGAPPVGKKIVKSIKALDPIEVELGTDIEDIVLPDRVQVTLVTSTTPVMEEEVELAVSWDTDTSDYNSSTPGVYKIYGTLVFNPTEIVNPNSVEAKQEVKVKAGSTPQPKGNLTLKVVDNVTSNEITDANPIYEVKKGGVIVPGRIDLELGDYEVTLKSYDETKYEAVGDRVKTVSLTAAQPQAEVLFTLKKKTSVPIPPPTPPVPPVNPTKYVLVGVDSLPKMETVVGTDIRSLNLPNEVQATVQTVPKNRKLRPGEKAETFSIGLSVTWDLERTNYDPERAGEYVIQGFLDTASMEIENPEGFRAEQRITVKAKDVVIVEKEVIRSVSKFPEMKVKQGTAASTLTLPGTVKVQVERVQEERPAAHAYGEMTEKEVRVHWDTSGYDGSTLGRYELRGDLDLSGTDMENPDRLEATLTVIVEERGSIIVEKTVIKEIVQPKTVLEVAYGTRFEELRLPKTVEVRAERIQEERPASEGSAEEVFILPVQWNAAGYDRNRIGVQKIYGTLDLSGREIENPKHLEVEQEIRVSAKIEDPTPIDPPRPNDPVRPERPTPPTKPNTGTETVIPDEKTPLGEVKENQWRKDWTPGLTTDLKFMDIIGHPFEAAIRFAVANGIFKGTSETTFEPERKLTRGMLVTILHRLTENPSKGADVTFTDTPPQAYYMEALKWAVSKGIITGYADGTFRSDAAPTREEFAVMLDRYAKLVNIELTVLNNGMATNIDGTGNWAITAVNRMLSTGVMTGEEGAFLPKQTLSRAEVAQILKNLYDATVRVSMGR